MKKNIDSDIIKLPRGYDNYNIKPTKIYLGSLKSDMCRMLNTIKNPNYWMVTHHLCVKARVLSTLVSVLWVILKKRDNEKLSLSIFGGLLCLNV